MQSFHHPFLEGDLRWNGIKAKLLRIVLILYMSYLLLLKRRTRISSSFYSNRSVITVKRICASRSGIFIRPTNPLGALPSSPDDYYRDLCRYISLPPLSLFHIFRQRQDAVALGYSRDRWLQYRIFFRTNPSIKFIFYVFADALSFAKPTLG